MLVAEKNRLKLAIGSVRKDITAHIRFLEKRIDDTDADLRRQIRAHESFRFTDGLLQSVPSISDVSSSTLIALLPELSSLSHRKIAALIGLAPFNDDSGRRTERRHIWGDRNALRSALYMATISAFVSTRRSVQPTFARLPPEPHECRANGLHAQTTHHPQRDRPPSTRETSDHLIRP